MGRVDASEILVDYCAPSVCRLANRSQAEVSGVGVGHAVGAVFGFVAGNRIHLSEFSSEGDASGSLNSHVVVCLFVVVDIANIRQCFAYPNIHAKIICFYARK